MQANFSSNFSNFNHSDNEVWASYPTFAPTVEVDESDLHLHLSRPAALIGKFTAVLSAIGSYIILREIFKDKGTDQTELPTVICNFLISLSVADVLSSVMTILGTMMSPAAISEYVWGAMGTVVTCEIQGFIFTLGYMASPLFNCALTATFTLMVRYRKRDHHLKPYQFYVHGTIWLFALTVAVIPLFFDWYNNEADICSIAPSPYGCTYYDDVPCDRGGPNAHIYGLALQFSPTVSIVFCGICMCLIWSAVHTMENRASAYSTSWRVNSGTQATGDPSSAEGTVGNADGVDTSEISRDLPQQVCRPDRAKSREMMKQGLFFILAFFITYVPMSLRRLVEGTAAHDILLVIVYGIFLPLQGFWNCLVFIRQRQMKTLEGRVFRYIFFCKCRCNKT